MDQARTFGVVPQARATALGGLEFLRQMLAGTLPSPPFAETTDMWPISADRGRVVFEAAPSARFYNPMGMVHGGWLGTVLDKNLESPEKQAEMEVRSLTGVGAEKATEH